MRGQLYDVPVGTRAAKCARCPMLGYWIQTATGARLLIDCTAPTGTSPTATSDGVGVSHFETCPAASVFSGRNRKRS